MKEDKLPTATELYHKGLNGEESLDSVEKCMIEFAKLHVEAALKEANEKVNYQIKEFNNVMPNCVLNTYPLSNIK